MVGAWVALAVVEPGLVALEDLVRAGSAVPAYGNLVVRPAVAGREAPAAVEAAEALVVGLDRVAGLEPAVEAGALAAGQEPVAGLELVEAEALVVGPGRVASLELMLAGALAVGQEPVAGLGPAVEAAQVGVAVVQVEVAELGEAAVEVVRVEEAELGEAAVEEGLAGRRVPRPGNG